MDAELNCYLSSSSSPRPFIILPAQSDRCFGFKILLLVTLDVIPPLQPSRARTWNQHQILQEGTRTWIWWFRIWRWIRWWWRGYGGGYGYVVWDMEDMVLETEVMGIRWSGGYGSFGQDMTHICKMVNKFI
ncbi:hypothetical protein AVEN_107891-1 [Araneus ventricosus]|uniref:Uncharacterized protein n=1 Tax=Araneus ventricosus TaxID=182803 RepID=A0A4Y2W6L6_ARAVE|nr:hypothetical protein AVEN_107891-1 [Araneus ventricosus]